MKKRIFLYIFLAFVILGFIDCSVNSFTGLIKVENHTNIELRNVKIGDTLIVRYLAGGNDYYYWYFTTLTGELAAEGIDITPAQDGESFEVETGNWVYITAAKYPAGAGESESYLSLSIEKQGP